MISNIYMPVRCIVGRGCVEQSGGIFASAGKRCLIVTGRSSARLSGALGDAEKALQGAGISYDIFDGIAQIRSSPPAAPRAKGRGISGRNSYSA